MLVVRSLGCMMLQTRQGLVAVLVGMEGFLEERAGN